MNIANNKERVQQYITAILCAVAFIILVYPFIPEITYQTKSFTRSIFGGQNNIYENVVAITHDYALIGTDEESKLNMNIDIDARKSLLGVDWSAQNILKGINPVSPENSNGKIIIPKIDVEMPIIVSNDSEEGLRGGTWILPRTSTPDKGRNTVLLAHRLQNNLSYSKTFYNLDKLKQGDVIVVEWGGLEYHYIMSYSEIVKPEQTEVLNPSIEPIVTLITCDPWYSTENRLVVTAALVNVI